MGQAGAVRQEAPAVARNREPIALVLAEELPRTGLVLEIASGTGEHAVFFARRFGQLQWQPSDPNSEALASIEAWRSEAGLRNVLPPIELDASAPAWPVDRAAALLCINMVHISPWTASEGLFAGAARLLEGGAPLMLYGPYLEDAVETAPSNVEFDLGLRRRNPAWGIRRIEDIDRLARANGLARTRRVEMPANNLLLVYRKG
ncbi:MAG TPA: DUF938 domain-containing protein [Sphingomonadaceae bacterium]|nr:DUF938 domain-containing protein [Sphingomonadaceae bacterium]